MKLPDPAVLEKVTHWLAYADEDLRFAQHGFSMLDSRPHHLIAYHAQQCAEKYLKAYLIFHVIDFPYTHDIAQLLEMCAAHAPWAGELRDAEELTPYAIAARYPGEDEEVGEAEARRAVEVAVRVRETVRRSLREEGFEI
jgi:HEPN domain-containing protein